MISFQRILFPVDLSEECTRTAPFVKAFADRFRSDVILLHVFEVPLPLAGVLDSPAWPQMINFDEARAVRQSQLDSFLPGGFAGLKICRQMADGDPALQIVSYAREGSGPDYDADARVRPISPVTAWLGHGEGAP